MSISTLSVPTYTPTGSGISIRASQSTELLGSNLDDNFALLANKLNEVINYEFGALDGVTFDGTKLMVGPTQSEMVITNVGNVGLGTSAPFATQSTSRFYGLHLACQTPILRLDDNDPGSEGMWDISNNSGTLVFNSRDNDGTGSVNHVQIDRSGKVGIGTTDPTHDLTIGDGTDSSWIKLASVDGSFQIGVSSITGPEKYFSIYDTEETSHRFVISESGEVGVGTSAPSAKTNIENGHLLISQSQSTTQENILLQGSGYRLNNSLYGNVSIRSYYKDTTNSADLSFYTAETSTATEKRMTIKGEGKVGIGTDSPWALLEVETYEDADRSILANFKTIRGLDDSNGDPIEYPHNYSGSASYTSAYYNIATNIETAHAQTINTGTYDGGYRIGLYINGKAQGGANGSSVGGGLDGRLYSQVAARLHAGSYSALTNSTYGPTGTMGSPTGEIDNVFGVDLTNYISADVDIGTHYGIKQDWSSGDSTSGVKARQIKNYFASRTGIGREAIYAKLDVHCTDSDMQFDATGTNETATPLCPLMVSNQVSGVIGERFSVDVADTRITNNTSQGTKLLINNTFNSVYDCNWQLHSDSNGEFKIGYNPSGGGGINNKIIARTNGYVDLYDRIRVNMESTGGYVGDAAVDAKTMVGDAYAYHMTAPGTASTSLGGLWVEEDAASAGDLWSELYIVNFLPSANSHGTKVRISGAPRDSSGDATRLYIEDGDAEIRDGWLRFTLHNFSSNTGIASKAGLKYVADSDDTHSVGSHKMHAFYTGSSDATDLALVIRKDGNVGIGGSTNPGNKLEIGNVVGNFSGNELAFGDGSTGGALNVSTNHNAIPNDNYVRLMSTKGIKFTPGDGTTYVAANEMTLNGDGDLNIAGDLHVVGSTTGSDYRLKENIAPISGSSLDRVSKIKPSSYTLKRGGRATEGFIAHELEEVLPHAVRGEKDAVKTVQVVTPAKGEAYTPAVEGVEEVTEVRTTKVEKTEPREVSEEKIEEVDGKYVKSTVVKTINETVYEEVQVYDEDGNPEMVCTLAPSERVYEDKEVTVFEHDEDGNVIGERTEIEKVQISEEREGCMEPLMKKVPVMIETSKTVVVTEGVEAKAEEVVASDILESKAPAGTLWRETTPESVEEVEEIDAQSVDYSSIIPVLVGAIQELTAKVKELESA